MSSSFIMCTHANGGIKFVRMIQLAAHDLQPLREAYMAMDSAIAGLWLNENLGNDKAANRPATQKKGKTSFIVILSLFKPPWIRLFHWSFARLMQSSAKPRANFVMSCLRVQQGPCLAIPRASGKDGAFPAATPAAARSGYSPSPVDGGIPLNRPGKRASPHIWERGLQSVGMGSTSPSKPGQVGNHHSSGRCPMNPWGYRIPFKSGEI